MVYLDLKVKALWKFGQIEDTGVVAVKILNKFPLGRPRIRLRHQIMDDVHKSGLSIKLYFLTSSPV
jgi:hypothetical protein